MNSENRFGLTEAKWGDLYVSEDCNSDAIAEVLEQICLGQIKRRESEIIRAVLFRTRRRRLDERKIEKRYSSIPALDHVQSMRDCEPWLELDRLEKRNRVRKAIDDIPSPLRETIKLRWIEGYSRTAIAELLRCPKKTVDDRLQRAHKRLRNKLRDFENPE